MSEAPSDTTDTTAVPAEVPAPAAAPAEVPAAPEAPVVPAEPTTDPVEPVPATEDSSTSDTAQNDSTPAVPVVVNDDNGQHVVMPDGSTVVTRSHTYPVSNAEQEAYELTHSGDQLRYAYKPGDPEYNPYSDPKLPNSQIAHHVEQEIISFAGRVLDDAEAKVSPIWHSFAQIFDGELKQAIETGGGSGKVEA